MAVWREASGRLGPNAVDMMDNARALPTAATTKAGRKIDLMQSVQLRCRRVTAIKMSDLIVRSFE
jgi:hypothetical protein